MRPNKYDVSTYLNYPTKQCTQQHILSFEVHTKMIKIMKLYQM